MNCPICDLKAELKNLLVTIDGEEYEIEGYFCCECDEEFLSYEQKARIDEVVKKQGQKQQP